MTQSRQQRIEAIKQDWSSNPRWAGIKRDYSAEKVVDLQGAVIPEMTLARRGAEKLWNLLHTEPYINCLGALTGGQAVQQVKAGIKAIYLSGWQVAADANLGSAMYPDQSLYPINSVPAIVERINNSFQRADQIAWSKGEEVDYYAPIVADAEAGFGGVLNAFELMKGMIRAGASGVHFEDQLASVKKCGHMGGKVLVPTQEAIQKLQAARLAADVMGVPTLVFARTDANAADLMTSDFDEYDAPFVTGERTSEGFFRTKPDWIRRLHAVWPMRHMLMRCGVRRRPQIWMRRVASRKQFMLSTQASCWRTTVHRRSTGRKTWTMRPLPSSSVSWVRWAISTSSSPWPASTACGMACSTWRMITCVKA